MKYLLILLTLMLAGCDPNPNGSTWVVTGKLEGATCGLVPVGIGNAMRLGNCVAVVRSQGPEQVKAYDVEQDLNALVGKEVNVVRLASSRYYRVMEVNVPKAPIE